MASSARWRRPSLSSAMNHCSVARKSVGFLQRQQCGYVWLSGTWAIEGPHPPRCSMILRIGLPHRHPREVLHVGDEAPVVVHRVVDPEPGLAPELVVLLAVAGGDVHEAGARVHRHEVRREHGHVAVDPGMRQRYPRGRLRTGRCGMTVARPADGRRAEGRPPREDARRSAPRRPTRRRCRSRRVHGDRQVGRERPRRGGPDHERGGCAVERLGQGGRRGLHRKAHVDGRRGLVLVLHLGLGQGRLAVHAPVHRLRGPCRRCRGRTKRPNSRTIVAW